AESGTQMAAAEVFHEASWGRCPRCPPVRLLDSLPRSGLGGSDAFVPFWGPLSGPALSPWLPPRRLPRRALPPPALPPRRAFLLWARGRRIRHSSVLVSRVCVPSVRLPGLQLSGLPRLPDTGLLVLLPGPARLLPLRPPVSRRVDDGRAASTVA